MGAALGLFAAPIDAATVRVQKCRARSGVIDVAMTIDVGAPPGVVWRVLTDYERMPRFVPGIESSRITDRTPRKPKVEQVAIAHVLFVGQRVTTQLQMYERPPDRLMFRAIGGQVANLRGGWMIRGLVRGGTRVWYRGQMSPPPLPLPDPVLAWVAREELVPRARAIGVEAERRVMRPDPQPARR